MAREPLYVLTIGLPTVPVFVVVQPIHPVAHVLKRHVCVHVRRGRRVPMAELFLHYPQVPGLAQQMYGHRVPAAVISITSTLVRSCPITPMWPPTWPRSTGRCVLGQVVAAGHRAT